MTRLEKALDVAGSVEYSWRVVALKGSKVKVTLVSPAMATELQACEFASLLVDCVGSHSHIEVHKWTTQWDIWTSWDHLSWVD